MIKNIDELDNLELDELENFDDIIEDEEIELDDLEDELDDNLKDDENKDENNEIELDLSELDDELDDELEDELENNKNDETEIELDDELDDELEDDKNNETEIKDDEIELDEEIELDDELEDDKNDEIEINEKNNKKIDIDDEELEFEDFDIDDEKETSQDNNEEITILNEENNVLKDVLKNEIKEDEEELNIDDEELEDEPENNPIETSKDELKEIKKDIEKNIDDEELEKVIKKPKSKKESKRGNKKKKETKKVKKELKEEKETENKKELKPKKQELKEEKETNISGFVIYNPNFDLDLLIDNRYQIRKTKRSKSDIEELAEHIRLQGQVEPIQVLKKGHEYYLMAGFGRVEALKFLNRTTAKALIYQNLPEDDIQKICIGSNVARTKLTEWDKICSVGEFFYNNPLSSVDNPDPSLNLRKIFGFTSNAIYNYIRMYKFYKGRSQFKKLFNKKPYPAYVYSTIMNILNKHKEVSFEDKVICKRLSKLLEKEFNQKSFKHEFINILSEYIVELQARIPSIEDENIDDDLKEDNLKKAYDDFQKEIKEEQRQIEKNEELIDIRLDNMLKSLRSIEIDINRIESINGFKTLLNETKYNKTVNKISEIYSKIMTL